LGGDNRDQVCLVGMAQPVCSHQEQECTGFGEVSRTESGRSGLEVLNIQGHSDQDRFGRKQHTIPGRHTLANHCGQGQNVRGAG